MTASEQFFNKIIEIITRAGEDAQSSISTAADLIARRIQSGNQVYIWGPGGHSSIFAEDVLCRKCELAALNPIIDPGVSLSHGAVRSIFYMEKIEGLGKVIVTYNGIGVDDVIVIGSAYGINPVLIEGVVECKARGAQVIAITSVDFSNNAKFQGAKHKSGALLYQLADVCIDSCVPPEDGVVEIDGFERKTTPVATIMQLVMLKALMAETIEKLVKAGFNPPIWTSSLVEGGIEANENNIAELWGKVKAI